jgi:pimeloyl-ACP methyl ester carboxylesterase
MIYILLLTVIVLFSGIIYLLLRAFRNPVRVHDATPGGFNIAYKEVLIPAKNNKKLYGWQIKGSPDKPVLILVHGWGRNVGKMLPYIKNLHPKGYGLLVFDSRNHGHSDADDHSSMLKFAEDILASVDYLQKHENITNGIGVIGLSIGGAASVYAAAHDNRIKAVVTVGAFADPVEIMRREMTRRHIPYFPFVWMLFKVIQWKTGKRFSEIAPVNNIARARARFLIIHGDKDEVVPPEQAYKLINAAGPQKAKPVIIKNRRHSDCHLEKGFWEIIDNFFKKAFNL